MLVYLSRLQAPFVGKIRESMSRFAGSFDLRNIFFAVLSGLFLGVITGHVAWCLVLALFVYIWWMSVQVRKLRRWLSEGLSGPPPTTSGSAEVVFQQIYKLRRSGVEDRERWRALARHIRASFAVLDDAVVMIDPAGNIEWNNIAARKLLGLKYPQDVSQPLLHLIRDPDFRNFYQSENYDNYYSMTSPQNTETQLQIKLTFFGKRSRILFARDITQTYLLEQTRKDFVANASHELRTPLTVINGYLQTFIDNDEGNNPRLRRAYDQMLEQSSRMEALVRDLMSLSVLESVGELSGDIEPIDVGALVELIKRDVQLAVDTPKQIVIECSDIRLLGQKKDIHSAFSNLVLNAAKYTEADGRIVIKWYADGDNAFFEVEDNGIGIEAHHLPRLTERFYRVDKSRSISTGGTGLGLAIVKHVLLRYGGHLEIESTAGQGSRFICVFPISQAVINDNRVA